MKTTEEIHDMIKHAGHIHGEVLNILEAMLERIDAYENRVCTIDTTVRHICDVTPNL